MYSFLYLSVVIMSFLLVYLLIGHELMVALLLFFILITLLGIYTNENNNK